jgi:hypothetical protein
MVPERVALWELWSFFLPAADETINIFFFHVFPNGSLNKRSYHHSHEIDMEHSYHSGRFFEINGSN